MNEDGVSAWDMMHDIDQAHAVDEREGGMSCP